MKTNEFAIKRKKVAESVKPVEQPRAVRPQDLTMPEFVFESADQQYRRALSEQGVAEGSMYSDEEVSWEKGGRRAPTGAFRNPAAGGMPVNKYIANELDTLLMLAQDRVDNITNRSRGGYGNKKSGDLEDAIFELSGVCNGFHSSMAEGVAELQELNSGLPRIGNWIMRNLKKVGNRIDLPQLIKQETSNNQGVTEGEGMSRAAKGYEKYGKDGMAALAKAGREGRALDPVRQKYDRYDEDGRLDLSSPEEKAARKAYIKAHGHPPPLTPDSVVDKYNPGDDIKVRDYYLRRKGIPQDKLDKMKEDATGGSTGSSSVSAVVTELGAGGMTKQQLRKRQADYTNVRKTGGLVKVKRNG